MEITFAITTDFSDEGRLEEIFQSIRELNISYYEILCIGGAHKENTQDTTYIYFDETQKDKWITRKKNILCQQAKYDIIVLMHDYYLFDKDWYRSYLEFGTDWDLCSNPQLLINGRRHFQDWVVWDSPNHSRLSSIDYDDWSLTRYMFQAGGYMVVKRQMMLDNPLNEDLVWGQAEDLIWSLGTRNKYVWKCNSGAIVRHNKKHRDCTMKINLGSGYTRFDGFVNIDDDPNVNPEYLLNIDDVNIRLPFEDNEVDEVKAHQILEHIGDGFIPLLQELYRVCKHGAIIDIICPHHLHENYYGDPTHKRPITVNTMNLFSKKANRAEIDRVGSNSGLGIKYNVDFEVVWFDYKFDSFYDRYLNAYRIKEQEGTLTSDEQLSHVRLMREAANVASDVMIKMVVVKE